MWLPTIHGVIDRRILVNYRVDPDVLAPLLPAPFRPQIHNGFGWAGICLIRLAQLRPRFVPPWLGLTTENAAHRIAVEWDDGGSVRTGVYVPRRDSNSRFNVWAGGRLFPGVHHLARFESEELNDRYRIDVTSADGNTHIAVRGRESNQLPDSSAFDSLSDASEFFRGGAVGFSPNRDGSFFESLELYCHNWRATPLELAEARSSFFDDANRFPAGSIALDCALLMRKIKHEWHSLSGLPAPPCRARATPRDYCRSS